MHIDPKARKEKRYKINLNHYQAGAIEALAHLHRKQPASYLNEIIEAHLEAYRMDRRGHDSEENNSKTA